MKIFNYNGVSFRILGNKNDGFFSVTTSLGKMEIASGESFKDCLENTIQETVNMKKIAEHFLSDLDEKSKELLKIT